MAIIGYGGMGQWHHKCILKNVPEITVKGAYDVRSEALETATDAGLHTYDSLQSALSDPEVGIVLIATTNEVHKDIAIAALEAGKHVICEKPVTMNAAELEEIAPVAKKSGKIFTIHHNRRWDKDFVTARKILTDDTIGKPYYIETRVQGARRNMHGWRGYVINGGGMVLDWGIHLLDQLLYMIDSPVVSVDSHLFQVFSSEVEDNFKTFLRFGNGLSAMVEISTNCFIFQPRWHISCEGGTAVIDNFSCEGKIVKLICDEQMGWADEIVYTAAGPTRTMAPRPNHTMETLPLPEITEDFGDYHENTSPFYKNFVKALKGEEKQVVTIDQALRVMKLIDLIFKCANQGHGEKCNI